MGRFGADSDGSQNRPPDVPQRLDNFRGVRKMKILQLKSEIAQPELSDLIAKTTPVANPQSFETMSPSDLGRR